MFRCPISGSCGACKTFYGVSDMVNNGLNTIAMPPPSSADAAFVYTIEGSANGLGTPLFVQLKKSDGTFTTTVQQNFLHPEAIAFDAVNSQVFVLAFTGNMLNMTSLYRMKPDGSQLSAVVTPLVEGGGIDWGGVTTDATNVYFAETGTGSVWYGPLTAPSKNLAMSGLQAPEGVFSTGMTLWVADSGMMAGQGAIYRCAVNTTCPNPTPFANGQNGATAIVVDETNAYWVNYHGNQVMRCPVTGCASPTLLATTTKPLFLTQDATAIYYSSSSGLFKLAK
jgi:hypothetical protein